MTVPFDPFAGPLLLSTSPTTEHQREIWTASQLGDDASLAYNESIRLSLHGSVDVDAISRSFDRLVERHEALRSNVSPDGLLLCICEARLGSLEVRDLRAHDEPERARLLAELLEGEVTTTFSLSEPGLYRARLVLLGPERSELVFTAHHLVCDGWSMGVIVRDWAALYDLELAQAGKLASAAALSPVSLSFGDYARQEAGRSNAEKSSDEGYWLSIFRGEPPVLELPLDRNRPPQRTFDSRREDVVLDAELVGELRKTSVRLRASLFATLLGGFQALLLRLSGQTDVVVGVPFAGQSLAGLDDLVGHAVNMLPLRAQVELATPFEALVATVKSRMLDAQEHQNYTLGTLLSKLPIARDPSRAPLVNVTFNLDRALEDDSIRFAGLRASLHSNPRRYENFDLFINAVERAGTIELECQYNSNLFDRATIRRWLDAYRRLLSSVVQDASQNVGSLDLLPATDVDTLAVWNRTEADFPSDLCVHALVEEQARRTPGAVAVEFQGVTLTYEELNQRADALATKLAALGVAPGQYVGLCLERSPDLIVSALAIWKAGAAYVPLDPDYPAERLAFMVSDSGMKTLVTHSRLLDELRLIDANLEHPVRPLLIDRLDDVSSADSGSIQRATPEDVAYVIYTSGSTGKPKGVMVPHRAVSNLLSSVKKRPGLSSDDVVLAITTLSFDIAVSEIWLPLVVGARIVLTTREIASDGALLRDVVEQSGVTFIDATPATYRLLLGAGFRGSNRLTLICTGEAMPLDLARQLLGHSGALWNGYGPTETTVWSTFWQAHEGLPRVLIGRPVDNTQIYILDENQKPVPIGVTGEMYIGGEGVTLGYLNRPDLTRERFVSDPFRAGSRMYRTGDLARYLPSGDLECLGRNDHQVKLRGFRIELGEIEDALIQHPGVAQATVILREDTPGQAALVAYLVVTGAAAAGPAELRAHLKTTLPDYMVPALYVNLPQMPLTPSGKIDRKALPAPDVGASRSTAEFVAPRTPTETLLAELWSDLLHAPRISVEDDFFALGGHSLLASQILGRLRRDHGIELSFRKFFEAPTIARLALVIDAATASRAELGSSAPKRSLPTPRAPGTPVPLSISQERLFLLEEMHPGQRVVHNLPAAWEFRGQVDPELVQKSLDLLAERHETLRTTVGGESGRPLQRVLQRMFLPIGVRDLRSLPESDRRAAMMEEIHRDSHEPFDLERGPLFRSTLFQLEDELWVYFTLRHNLVWDGWSFDIFLGELAGAYSALSRGEAPALPALPISYGDYVLWHRRELESAAVQEQVKWWENELDGAPADLDLPHDFPRRTQSTYAGGNTSFTITKEQAAALTQVAHEAGTTLFMVMYAAYTVLLHRYSGQREVLVGLPVRGRALPEVENLIGPFTNTIVLRTALDPSSSFLDHLRRVRDRSLESFSHEEMPLEMLGPKTPIVRALFSFQDARARPLTLGDVPIHQIDVEHPAAANDLMIWTVERSDKLVAIANYNAEIFERSSIERLLRSFSRLLDAIVENPRATLDALPLLAASDAERILEIERRSTPVAATNAFELFQRAASTFASRTALDAPGGESLRFDELDQRARRFAAGLERAGVKTGDVVALLLPRSADAVAAVLGAWLLGAVPLPLDPSAPRDVLLPASGAKPVALVAASSAISNDFDAWPDVRRLLVAELTSGPEFSGSPAVSPSATAWLRSVLASDGSLRFEPLSHEFITNTASALLSPESSENGRLDAAESRALVTLSPLSAFFPIELLATMSRGATLGWSEAPSDEERLTDVLAARSFDVALAPGSAWSAALADERPLPPLALVTGDAPLGLLEALAEKTRVLHVTAPSFATPLGFVNEFSPRRGLRAGRPLGSAGLTVVDDRGERVPFGVRGHLELRTTSGAVRLDRRGRVFADGSFELDAARSNGRDAAGSVDVNGVDVNGHVVELAGLARKIEELPSVARALVDTGSAAADGTRLIAYFVPAPGESVTEADLRRHLRARLPEALVPHFFIELEKIPEDEAGAVRFERLPSPFSGGGAEHVEPRTKSEQLLGKLFRDVLGLSRVSVNDNFFDLGGHSLLCLRVVAQLETETGKRISPRVLLLNTLGQAAQAIDELGPPTEPKPTSTTIGRAPDKRDSGLASKVFRGLSGFLKG